MLLAGVVTEQHRDQSVTTVFIIPRQVNDMFAPWALFHPLPTMSFLSSSEAARATSEPCPREPC